MSRANALVSRSEISDNLIHPGRRMTEREFVGWVGDGWAEWVDGEVTVMSPVNFQHAEVFSFLFALIHGFVDERGLGRVLTEPFQVRFPREKSRRSPDIFFLSEANANLIREQHVEGAPDLIIEITSPDSQSRDRREKFLEYETAGVREYWIVDPLSRSLEAYSLEKGESYEQLEPTDNRAVRSKVLKGFYIKSDWLWRLKLPKIAPLLREMKRKR